MDCLLWVVFVAPGIYRRFIIPEVKDLRMGKTQNAVKCIRNYRQESCMASSESFLHVGIRGSRLAQNHGLFPRSQSSWRSL